MPERKGFIVVKVRKDMKYRMEGIRNNKNFNTRREILNEVEKSKLEKSFQ